ncbi:MAG: bifunctional demethylmenaquinone methyltransferase/2-methoxy-6-polyprenyl-1,4-benzoquinol methylase UbiE [Muribaculaceae bacterium]|nr:bifunctional demethylmenaquinone methyltransferase/2-methoxy-6-polyprenyl-1,4-benzoquinol methylase UbiE [Muribaculaceae bacterium]
MDIKAEKIKPYTEDDRAKTEQVQEMFDNIAPAYDFMNGAMTMGLHKLWLGKAVKLLKAFGPEVIVDLATGTADVAVAMAKAMPHSRITGIDLSENMVKKGREKVKRHGLEKRISLETGDILKLNMPDAVADAVTIAYGVRNLEHLKEGYAQMLRILRPGGMLCVVELSTPRGKLTGPLYRFYTRHIIPRMGRLFSRDTRAYSYLPESIAAVPQGHNMLSLMEEVGFMECKARPLTFGVCTIYTAIKP